ncbi:MAG: ParB N-terminal domain-containing protein [Thermoplasmata archaeon]|jgi:hypothetical protein
MSSGPTFEWWSVDRVLIHEQYNREKVEELAAKIRQSGVCRDPLWIDRETGVLLDGHHRFAALRLLGAVRVPVWAFEYEDDAVITLERWNPGPAIAKSEVVRRAREGRPFPPKTTRHVIHVTLPSHPTALSEVLGPVPADAATG